MNAKAILERLYELGVQIEAARDKLRLTPASAVPANLVDAVRANKAALLAHLRYHRKYTGNEAPGNAELREMQERVYSDGVVLLWSTVLEDFIAFYKTEADRKKIPPGFVPYSDKELRHLFGPDKPDLSESTNHLMHRAKVLGTNITDSYPEDVKTSG